MTTIFVWPENCVYIELLVLACIFYKNLPKNLSIWWNFFLQILLWLRFLLESSYWIVYFSTLTFINRIVTISLIFCYIMPKSHKWFKKWKSRINQLWFKPPSVINLQCLILTYSKFSNVKQNVDGYLSSSD